MISIILYTFATILFYLMGAFPTGTIIAKRKGIDLTKEGSGNVGATNVARTLGKKAGMLTLLGDVSKGLLPLLLASILIDSSIVSYFGIALVAGHCFSIPGKMKGGKGVATALGVFLFISPYATLAGLVSFGVMIRLFKIVSLASVTAAVVVPLYTLLTDQPDFTIYPAAVISLIIIFRHRENLIRLTEGREKKMSFASESKESTLDTEA